MNTSNLLADLGWTADFVRQLELDEVGTTTPARVTGVHRNRIDALMQLPSPAGTSLCHGDFRMGNLLVMPEGLSAVLDWELAHLGDPVQDLAFGCIPSWRFGRYDKPLGAMRAYLEGVHKGLPAGEEPPVVVAALGPKMLALSAEKSRGAVPYNVTPKHTAQAAAILGPGKTLAVEQKVTLETDPVRARALGRKELSRYMGLPNYRNNWLREGFSEADLADGGSDRFIDAMVRWGDAETIKKGLRAHFTAGATHVCLQPVHDDGDFAARDRMLAALADT